MEPPKFEVVVSGMSGRFPQCDDVATFKRKLYNYDNFLSVSDERWPIDYKHELDERNVPNATGKYTTLEDYDARFFRISHVFAKSNDIINRKVLEPSYEAIMDAGINPYALSGENVGVFMSSGINDIEGSNYERKDPESLLVIGMSKTMESNRISFGLNFTGPSFTYQSDPLGSLEAFTTGYRYVADGTISAALVGVATAVQDPKNSYSFMSLGYLSPDGISRVFDQSANGYGRSESTIVYFLQRSEDAKRSYGTISFVDTFYLGLKPSTVIGYDEDVLYKTYEKMYENKQPKNVKLSQIEFMEMGANAIKRLESLESNVVEKFFCRNRKQPLLVGSVKSNVGNTEAAAPYMSIMKTLFALDDGTILPNLHVTKLNEEIRAFKNKRLKVVTEPTKLSSDVVAVNSVGFSGTVSHVIFKRNAKRNTASTSQKKLPRLLLISGRTEEGLTKKMAEIEALEFNEEFVAMVNDVFLVDVLLYSHRGYTILPAPAENPMHAIDTRGDKDRPVWLVFSGMGSQWNGMGKDLLDIPVFAQTIARCDAVLRPRGIDIYEILTTDDAKIFDNIVNSFVAIISMQVALYEVIKVLGIEAHGIIGHSVGENGCAYADGCLTLEQAVSASYERGMASIETKTINGMMAAIGECGVIVMSQGKGYNEIKDSLPEGIEVACHNSANSSTLSGPTEKINKFVDQLKRDGVFAKSVNVANIAYHSQYIAPAAPQLLSRLQKVIPEPKERSSKWISTSVPESDWDKPMTKYCSAEYLTNNLLKPVLFEEGSRRIPDNAIIIEIAPHGLLQAILKRTFPNTCTNVSLTRKSDGKNNLNYLLGAIGSLYIAGLRPNVNALYPEISYPVPRNTPSISPYCTWNYTDKSVTNELPPRSGDTVLSALLIPIKLNEGANESHLQHHKIKGRVVVPPAALLHIVWKMLSRIVREKIGDFSVIFENVQMHKNFTLSMKKTKFVSVMIQKSGLFELLLGNNHNHSDLIMSGIVITTDKKLETRDEDFKKPGHEISKEQFYANYKNVGYNLSDCFTPVEKFSEDDTGGYAQIAWNNNWVPFLDAMMKMKMFTEMRDKKTPLYPFYIKRIVICCSQQQPVEKTSISVRYDKIHNKIIADGMAEMSDVKFTLFPKKFLRTSKDDAPLKLRELQFVSFSEPRCQDAAAFLKFCLEVVFDTIPVSTTLNIVGNVSALVKNIQTIIKQTSYLKANITFDRKNNDGSSCELLLTTNVQQLDPYDLARYHFVLAHVSKMELSDNAKIKQTFCEITKQSFKESTMCLLKNKVSQPQHRLIMNQPGVTGSELKSKCNVDQIVIRHDIEFKDLSLILDKRKRDFDTKYVYIMDTEDKVRNEKSVMQSHVAADLSVLIRKDGQWGTYKNISSLDENSGHDSKQSTPSNYLDEIRIESFTTHFFATEEYVSHADNDESAEFEDFGIEYSGVDRLGNAKMGLALINPTQLKSTVDDVLSWKIPKGWSMEDATTVPFIYTRAYYFLILMERYYSSSVLINMGREILLTEVCVRLFLSKKYTVFVTVANEDEAAYVEKKFPQLGKNRIFNADKCEYEVQLLLATKGKGVNFVINCLPGMEHVIASLNAVSKAGYYIETVKTNFNIGNGVGMFPFLKMVKLIALPYKIRSLLNLPKDDKIMIQNHLRSGIEKGEVTPLPHVTLINGLPECESSHSQYFKKIVKSLPQNLTNLSNTHKISHDKHRSYIIVVGERKDHFWIELLEWLVNQGAANIIVVFENVSIAPRMSHRINRLVTRNKSFISLTTSYKIDTSSNASNIVSLANKLAPLEAIYFVAMDSGNETMRFLDKATQLDPNTNVHFISLFSGGLKEFEARRSKGYPAAIIHGEMVSKNYTTFLHDIHKHLNASDPNNSPVLYDMSTVTNESTMERKLCNLAQYLPNNEETWEVMSADMSKAFTFTERVSLSLPYAETRGVYPIFVIPSVHGILLDPLIRKLYYPVFTTSFMQSTNANSVDEITDILLKELNKIQPKGPVTIVSETWSSIVALELAFLIKSTGRKCHVFLLDGDFNEWKNCINNNHEFLNAEIERACNLQISSKKPLENKNTIDTAIQKVVSSLQHNIRIVSQHNTNITLLEDVTLFLSPDSQNVSFKISVTSDIKTVAEDAYENLLKNKEVSDTINTKALYSWWDC